MSTATQSAPVDHEIMYVDGRALTVRPIEITDVRRLTQLFGRLSRQSIYFRFFSPIRRLPSAALLRLAHVDHWRREALIALDGDDIVAVARYDALDASQPAVNREAEIAITVEDAWHRRGLGEQLLRRLAVVARDRGYDTFVARILPDNRAALGLMRKLVPDATVRFVGEYEVRLPLPSVHAPVVAPTARRRSAVLSAWTIRMALDERRAITDSLLAARA